MNPVDIRFASIKKDREWYFVEYFPPLSSYKFSNLELSILQLCDIVVVRALLMAINLRNHLHELIHHSDRGSQYASYAYQQLLNQHGKDPCTTSPGSGITD